jgi:hypothetical protein
MGAVHLGLASTDRAFRCYVICLVCGRHFDTLLLSILQPGVCIRKQNFPPDLAIQRGLIATENTEEFNAGRVFTNVDTCKRNSFLICSSEPPTSFLELAPLGGIRD